MLRGIFVSLLFLLTTSCGPRYVDYYPYHVDGSMKPRVALIPLCDASESFLPWDLASELNNNLRYHVVCSGNLFLVSENEVKATTNGMQEDLFSKDYCFAQRFSNCDYVVAMELIQHELVPYGCSKLSPSFPAQAYRAQSVLQMKVRLRVIDIRQKEPRIVLQEIFTSDYAIPCGGHLIDYSRIKWGCQAYPSTPWGIAHAKLVRDLVYRLETVISCS